MSAAAELEANKKRREDTAKRQAGELPPEQGMFAVPRSYCTNPT